MICDQSQRYYHLRFLVLQGLRGVAGVTFLAVVKRHVEAVASSQRREVEVLAVVDAALSVAARDADVRVQVDVLLVHAVRAVQDLAQADQVLVASDSLDSNGLQSVQVDLIVADGEVASSLAERASLGGKTAGSARKALGHTGGRCKSVLLALEALSRSDRDGSETRSTRRASGGTGGGREGTGLALTEDGNAVSGADDGGVRDNGLSDAVLVPNEGDVLTVTCQGNHDVLVGGGSVVGQVAVNVDLEEVLRLVGRIDIHVANVQAAVNRHADGDGDVRDGGASLNARRNAFRVQSPRSSARTRAASVRGATDASGGTSTREQFSHQNGCRAALSLFALTFNERVTRLAALAQSSGVGELTVGASASNDLRRRRSVGRAILANDGSLEHVGLVVEAALALREDGDVIVLSASHLVEARSGRAFRSVGTSRASRASADNH